MRVCEREIINQTISVNPSDAFTKSDGFFDENKWLFWHFFYTFDSQTKFDENKQAAN